MKPTHAEHTQLPATMKLAQDWTPDSWRGRNAMQQPQYDDVDALHRALDELRHLPPLVTSWEILSLKRQLAEAQEGKRFLLQAGDCAESFADCASPLISNQLKVLLQLSLVLVHGLQMPVVRVGRFAGQYAKPRSTDSETREGIALPSYRGDNVNRVEFSAAARRADPARLLLGHMHSALTLNFVRALTEGGFADLHHPEYWDLAWVEQSPHAVEYRAIVARIADAVRFMETLAGEPVANLSRADFYTSHEALLLDYEQALTRQVPRQWGWFNLSTHFPWIGMRTAAIDGAHAEYFRGIRNPIAVKIGPEVKPNELMRLIELLNPDDEPGRLTLIHRMGAARIASALPPLLDAVRATGKRVLWVCDPMHGNGETLASGVKTRRFSNIRSEIEQSFDLHAAAGTRLGGVHLELTGEDVTECLGGARALCEQDLTRAYRSTVDPRLNYEQALELGLTIVQRVRQNSAAAAPS
ncbi:MAG: class II 3-deoxy-7-phosphoheptulonate synthase [Metallibacterium scheffleri]